MKQSRRYVLEYAFLVVVLLTSVAGFWKIYFGADAHPNPYHHLHVGTVFIWLFLSWRQLRLAETRQYRDHRKVGLSILFLGPLLFATLALLTVHSAHKGMVSGQGDFLIVQNVGVTLELGLLVFLAFVLKKRRELHGALMMSTLLLFLGIALFFTLISFVPGYTVEGPETFYRFEKAGIAGQGICLVVGLIFLIRDYRNGWPYFLAGAFFPLNDFIRANLAERSLLEPLTERVGAMHQPLTFVGSFVLFAALLAATGVQNARRTTVQKAA